jgi:hypothetical protein
MIDSQAIPIISSSNFLYSSNAFEVELNKVEIKYNHKFGLVCLNFNPKYQNDKDVLVRMNFLDPSKHFNKVIYELQQHCEQIFSDKSEVISALTFKDLELVNLIKEKTNTFRKSILNFRHSSFEVREMINSLESCEIALEFTDVLVARHILEHTADPFSVLRNFYNALPSSGILIIEVPDCEEVYNGRFFKHFWEEHLQYFSEEILSNMVSAAGFKINTSTILTTEAEDIILIVATKIELPTSLEPRATKNPIQLIKTEMKNIKSFFELLERHNISVGMIGATHSNINIIDLFALIPSNYTFFEAKFERVGKYATKYLIKVYGVDEPMDHKIDIFISSISIERQLLFYNDFYKLNNINKVFSIEEILTRSESIDLHLLNRHQLLELFHSNN